MNALAEILTHYARAGVYAASPAQLEMASQSAMTIGFDCWRLHLPAAEAAPALLKQIGQALHFPEWYGENWDALADCLTDLSWSDADGFILLLHGSPALRTAQPALWQTLVDLLGEVSSFWCENQVAFWVLTDDTAGVLPDLPQGG
jgi:hypothetical protein